MFDMTKKIIFAFIICILSISCVYAASNRFFVPEAQPGVNGAPEDINVPEQSVPDRNSDDRNSDNTRRARSEGPKAQIDRPPVQTATEQGQSGTQTAGGADSELQLGQTRKGVEGEPLRIPKPVENMEFFAGNWSFDKFLKGPDGEDLAVDFFFDNRGRGASVMSDAKNNKYMAPSMAREEDGALFVQTGPFTNPRTGKGFNALYITCVNDGNGVICTGTDGFNAWSGERLVKGAQMADSGQNSGTAQNGGQGLSQGGPQGGKNVTQGGGRKDAGSSDAQRAFEEGRNQGQGKGGASTGVAGPIEKELTELGSGGAELSPVIMEKAPKATAPEKNMSVANLAGDWIYSQELARQSDGKGISLGFSFDKNGKGYSTIDDGAGNAFKAAAEGQLMPNGKLRVKTDAYEINGKQGYYPTFMECTRTANGELECDISNGWARINGGRLVARKAVQDEQKNIQLQDILDMGASGQGGVTGKGPDMAAILGDMSDMPEQETQSPQPVRPPKKTVPGGNPTPKSEKTLILPKGNTSMDFLEGKWRCNTGLANAATNEPVVVEFTFNNNGKGSALVRERNGQLFHASANASMRGGKLRINTSMFRSRNSGRSYEKSFIECEDKGNRAICSGVNGNIHWSGATFSRLK